MSPTFRRNLGQLPDEVREAAKEKFKFFKDNPFYPYHPSLRIKQMKGYPGIWEGHVTRGYVFTFHKETDNETGEIIFVFRKIGKHDIYDNP
jgi:mRNA-degrading endonuclease RelE of RelBE toxin-antitoxin system